MAIGDGKGHDPSMGMVQKVQAALSWSASTVSMVLMNKFILMKFRSPTTLLFLQNVMTIFFVQLREMLRGKPLIKPNLPDTIAWAPLAALATLSIYTSLLALEYISVSTFVVARNAIPILLLPTDKIIFGTAATTHQYFNLIAVGLGAFIYSQHDIDFSWTGYFWLAVHMIFIASYTVMVKLKSTEWPDEKKSFYNCIESLPFLAAIAIYREGALIAEIFSGRAPMAFWPLLAISGVLSTWISVSGFSVQRAFHPTAVMTMNNLNKAGFCDRCRGPIVTPKRALTTALSLPSDPRDLAWGPALQPADHGRHGRWDAAEPAGRLPLLDGDDQGKDARTLLRLCLELTAG